MKRPIASSANGRLWTAVCGAVLLCLSMVSPAAPQKLKILEGNKDRVIQGRLNPSRQKDLEKFEWKPRGWAAIHRLHAKRSPQGIVVDGVIAYFEVGNMQSEVVWTLSRLDGENWVKMQSGIRNFNSAAKFSVTEKLPATPDAVRLKLDVNTSQPNTNVSKEFTLPAKAKEFVVRYGTGGKWVLSKVFSSDGNEIADNLNAEYLQLSGRAKRFAAELNKLGLQTQLVTKTNDNGFGFWEIQIKLNARTDEERQERTFTDLSEAQYFRTRLIRRVRDNGLTVESIIVR